MNNKLILGVAALALVLSGCGATTESDIKGVSNNDLDKLQKAVDSGDSDSVKNAMGDIATQVGQQEAKDVAAMESKEVPEDFPTDLVYDMEGTKVFEVFNNDSEDRTFMSLDIKTPDDQYFLMGFYDGLLEDNDRWEIKSREESDVGGIYKLIDKEGIFMSTDITIVKGQYDELTTILISSTRLK